MPTVQHCELLVVEDSNDGATLPPSAQAVPPWVDRPRAPHVTEKAPAVRDRATSTVTRDTIGEPA